MSLAGGSRDYTDIRTVIGLLRYVRLLQGLNNSPEVFQRVVNAILGSREGRHVWAFIDDISMGTQTAEAHLLCLKSVLGTFIAVGARLKLSKYAFGEGEVEVLGPRIGAQGIKPSNLHVQAIRDLLQPQNGEDLMRFLGLANYFSEFVDHFADAARPLYVVLRGTGFNKGKRPGKRLVIPDRSSRWGNAQTKAWRHIKGALSHPPFLCPPEGAPKRTLADASRYRMGGASVGI